MIDEDLRELSNARLDRRLDGLESDIWRRLAMRLPRRSHVLAAAASDAQSNSGGGAQKGLSAKHHDAVRPDGQRRGGHQRGASGRLGTRPSPARSWVGVSAVQLAAR